VLHVAHEREFIALAQSGAADSGNALTARQLRNAIADTGVKLVSLSAQIEGDFPAI
jgi:hypothetical protein